MNNAGFPRIAGMAISTLVSLTVCCAAGETPTGPDSVAEESSAGCTTNADCGSDEMYCAKPAGECDGEGECERRPQLCTAEWDPVCGCDGKTYGNACGAHGSGVNVDYAGACEDEEPDADER